MALDAKLSTLVENQFPAFYKEEGPKFLAFIKAYYQYLETTGKQQDVQRNLQSYKDIDTTLDEYIKYFRSELMQKYLMMLLLIKDYLLNVLKICIQQKVQLIHISYYLKYFMMKMLK